MRNWCLCLAVLVCGTSVFAQAFDNRMDTPPQTPGGSAGAEKTMRVKRGTTWRIKPQRSMARDQLAYANELRRNGKLRAAYRAYNALVYAWPDTSIAVTAQVACAEVEEARQRYTSAFDEYQYLVDHYAGQFDYQAVLSRQFDIATRLLITRRGKFLFMPGFEAPERALPLFEKIIANAPSWDKAPLAQFSIGQIHEKNEEWDGAIAAYEMLQNRYDASPLAESAAYREAYCLYRDCQDRPNDENAANAARIALVRYLRTYPAAADAATAREYLNALNARQAKLVYGRAEYYDRIAKRPAAALRAYQDFLKRFPNSDLAETARSRIAALQQEVKPHETP